MASAFDIVMDSRKELVEKILGMMEKGYMLTDSEWNKDALFPYNPISAVTYKGGNRLKLMVAAIEKEYKDPRWMTVRQMKMAGYQKKPGAEGILCEKWIFEKKIKRLNDEGIEETVFERMEPPRVSFFVVYNAEQVEDFPALKIRAAENEGVMEILDNLM